MFLLEHVIVGGRLIELKVQFPEVFVRAGLADNIDQRGDLLLRLEGRDCFEFLSR